MDEKYKNCTTTLKCNVTRKGTQTSIRVKAIINIIL